MTEEGGVRAAVLDYVEGWFDGGAERMARALHPELVKRCRGLEGDDPDVMETLTAREMIDATAEGIGRDEDAEDRQIDIQITFLHGDLAGATCTCHRYVDLVHLLHMPEGWRIINAAWELR
ncbi:MAG: nuclear transport factor 2 family protein [Solirubrobacteraceae bacterium]